MSWRMIFKYHRQCSHRLAIQRTEADLMGRHVTYQPSHSGDDWRIQHREVRQLMFNTVPRLGQLGWLPCADQSPLSAWSRSVISLFIFFLRFSCLSDSTTSGLSLTCNRSGLSVASNKSGLSLTCFISGMSITHFISGRSDGVSTFLLPVYSWLSLLHFFRHSITSLKKIILTSILIN